MRWVCSGAVALVVVLALAASHAGVLDSHPRSAIVSVAPVALLVAVVITFIAGARAIIRDA
jgi:hypothetical protein